jgi:hypothetical protein
MQGGSLADHITKGATRLQDWQRHVWGGECDKLKAVCVCVCLCLCVCVCITRPPIVSPPKTHTSVWVCVLCVCIYMCVCQTFVKYTQRGIKNFTKVYCYINAVMQALLACSPLMKILGARDKGAKNQHGTVCMLPDSCHVLQG